MQINSRKFPLGN